MGMINAKLVELQDLIKRSWVLADSYQGREQVRGEACYLVGTMSRWLHADVLAVARGLGIARPERSTRGLLRQIELAATEVVRAAESIDV